MLLSNTKLYCKFFGDYFEPVLEPMGVVTFWLVGKCRLSYQQSSPWVKDQHWCTEGVKDQTLKNWPPYLGKTGVCSQSLYFNVVVFIWRLQGLYSPNSHCSTIQYFLLLFLTAASIRSRELCCICVHWVTGTSQVDLEKYCDFSTNWI